LTERTRIKKCDSDTRFSHMAEKKRVKAEEAENIDPIAKIGEETEATAAAASEEEVAIEEPLELYSTADDAAFLNEKGEFDWNAYETSGGYNASDRTKYDDIYGKTLSTIVEKEVVEGTVVSVNKKEVVVNIGYKSEGVIPVTEFRYNPDLKPGDVVAVYIEQQEDKNGQLNVSHKTARVFSAWSNVNRALESGEIIKGDVK